MILLTGATGKSGGEVAKHLAAAGIPFRALVRDADKAGPLRSLGAEIVVGDIGDAAALEQATAGIEKAFLVMPNIKEQLELEKGFCDAVKAAGGKHLIYVSSIESVPESTNPITQIHVGVEEHIRQSGLAWTMIRPTFFMQNFDTSARGIKANSQIVMPAGSGTLATTDLRDVGEVITKALIEPGHENQSYDLTGPDLLTMAQIAERFSEVLGRKIEYVDQPLEDFAKILQSINMSEWRTKAVCKEFESIAAGSIDHTTDTMEKLLGRPGRSIDEYIRDHIELFR